MALSEKNRKYLRGLAHPLKPLARVGNPGLSEGFMTELDRTLEHHELVKLRVSATDREARDEAIREIVARTGAELVHRIGHTAILYRPSREAPRLQLPD